MTADYKRPAERQGDGGEEGEPLGRGQGRSCERSSWWWRAVERSTQNHHLPSPPGLADPALGPRKSVGLTRHNFRSMERCQKCPKDRQASCVPALVPHEQLSTPVHGSPRQRPGVRRDLGGDDSDVRTT